MAEEGGQMMKATRVVMAILGVTFASMSPAYKRSRGDCELEWKRQE